MLVLRLLLLLQALLHVLLLQILLLLLLLTLHGDLQLRDRLRQFVVAVVARMR